MNQLGEFAVKNKSNIVIAPEGTRRRRNSFEAKKDRKDNFNPFKKGPFHLTVDFKLPVLPVVIIGASRVWPPG